MAPPEPPISDKDLQVIPGLRVQLSFRFYCLYNAILTSRTLTNHRDGYLLSIGDRKRVPPFKRLTIGIDPLPGVQGDDREIGEKILFLSDHRPFRTPGVLLMSMEGMCGYYLPSDVTPNGLVTLIRNLHGHLDGRGVSGYYQCLSQGLWSSFDPSNPDVFILELKYHMPPGFPSLTKAMGAVYSPIVTINRQQISNQPLHFQYHIMCCTILSALGVSHEGNAELGLHFCDPSRGPLAVGRLLKIGVETPVPHPKELQAVLDCFYQGHVVEIISQVALETFQSNAKATKYTERGLFSSVIAPTVAPAQLFIRTAPLQNQPDWNRNFQHTVYAGLRNEFDLKTLMAPSNRAVLHQIKNFPQVSMLKLTLGIGRSRPQFPTTRDAYIGQARLHGKLTADNVFPSSRSVASSFLILDDIDLPAAFLRSSSNPKLLEPFKDLQARMCWALMEAHWDILSKNEEVDSRESWETEADLPWLTSQEVKDRSHNLRPLPISHVW